MSTVVPADRTGRDSVDRPSLTWLDGLVSLAVAVPGLVSLVAYGGLPEPSFDLVYREADALGVVLCLLLSAVLLLRRSFPAATTWATSCIALVIALLDYGTIGPTLAMLFAVYAAGVFAEFWRGLSALAVVLVVSAVYNVAIAPPVLVRPIDYVSLLLTLLGLVGLWAIGRSLQARRRYTEELEERATRLERTRETEVRAALGEERARIARELHDVVAHHVSVMTVQAAGARRALYREPAHSETALAAIETTGRSALAEMRRIVGVLRLSEESGGRPAELSPPPGLGDLEELKRLVSSTGLPVELTVRGDLSNLPAGLDITLFRIVQEALTNIIKHADATHARATVRCGQHQVVVQVTDDGAGPPPSADERRPGHGLLGMRERVALYGGTLHVGPRPSGGFEVRARIPLDHSAV